MSNFLRWLRPCYLLLGLLGLSAAARAQLPKPPLTPLDWTELPDERDLDQCFWQLYKADTAEVPPTLLMGLPRAEVRRRGLRTLRLRGRSCDERTRWASAGPLPDARKAADWGYTLAYTYDPEGRIRRAEVRRWLLRPPRNRDERRQREWRSRIRRDYDAAGRLIFSQKVSWGPDMGLRDSLATKRWERQLSYDAAGRLHQELQTYVQRASVLDYDAPGHYRFVVRPAERVRRCYDYEAAGRLLTERKYVLTDSLPAELHELSRYGYDTAGRRTFSTQLRLFDLQTTYPGATAQLLTYQYAAGQLRSVTERNVSFRQVLPDTSWLKSSGQLRQDERTRHPLNLGSVNSKGEWEYAPYEKENQDQRDTLLVLRPGEAPTSAPQRGKVWRLDEQGRLSYWGEAYGYETYDYAPNYLRRSRAAGQNEDYECQHLWLTPRQLPQRQLTIQREPKHTYLLDQRYHLRPDGLPRRLEMRDLFLPALDSVAAAACTSCDLCQRSHQLAAQRPGWPNAGTRLAGFDKFRYQFYRRARRAASN